MPRIKSDLVDLLEAVGKGALQGKTIEIDPDHAVTIALVSGGYPGDYEKGKAISGLGNYEPTLVFHAGTRQQQDNVVTEGGRVLAVSGKGSSLEDARAKAYAVADQIQWDGLYFRKDIGQDLLNFKI